MHPEPAIDPALQKKYLAALESPEEGRILNRDFNHLDSLNGFEKVETLGKGAYAKVYHIRQKRTKLDFALKIYPKSYLSKPHRITNIRSEVFLLSHLSHQNIVPLLHVYESEDNVHMHTHSDIPTHGQIVLPLSRQIPGHAS